VIALDTSVVIPLFASWHEHHRLAASLLDDEPRIPIHAAFEAFAVLTRLPVPNRVSADAVVEFLDRRFPREARLSPDPDAAADLPRRCVEVGIDGGAIYDAIVAVTAASHGATLVSADRRAMPTYRAMGVPVRLFA
jgi:predicted nucleic acid-binding protein